jgi:hypothetical protein
MLLTRMHCDGCGRRPSFWEWYRGELSHEGYSDWRHPGVVFHEAGCPLTYGNRGKARRAFAAIFGRPLPEELSYLCPQCAARAAQELPGALAVDPGDVPSGDPPPGPWFGREPA